MQLPDKLTPEAERALIECIRIFARRGRLLREERERQEKLKQKESITCYRSTSRKSRIRPTLRALHAQAAVAVGHNCEGELATRYGYGVTERLPGFYAEIGQKDYIFTVIGPDYDTRAFVKSLYENDPNLLAFLKRVR